MYLCYEMNKHEKCMVCTPKACLEVLKETLSKVSCCFPCHSVCSVVQQVVIVSAAESQRSSVLSKIEVFDRVDSSYRVGVGDASGGDLWPVTVAPVDSTQFRATKRRRVRRQPQPYALLPCWPSLSSESHSVLVFVQLSNTITPGHKGSKGSTPENSPRFVFLKFFS